MKLSEQVNLNIITYIIYMPLISILMIKVGWLFYKNGEVFLHNLIEDNKTVKSINNLLLVGYYLVNIGYAIATIAYWEKISNPIQIVESLSLTLGKIILMLAFLHYNNVFWLSYLNSKTTIKF